MEITLTRALQEDLEDVVRLFNLYRIFYKQEGDIDAARDFISSRIETSDSVIFIARNAEKQAVGFTQLYPSFSSQTMQKLWILNDLYVEETYRGAGVASALLNIAKRHSASECAKGLLLCTQHTNSNAQALYLKHGFEPLNEFKWFFLAT